MHMFVYCPYNCSAFLPLGTGIMFGHVENFAFSAKVFACIFAWVLRCWQLDDAFSPIFLYMYMDVFRRVCLCVCEYIYAQGSTTNISQLNPKRATNKATSSKATQPLQWMNEQAEVTECGWVAEWVPVVSRWVSVWINDWLDDWAAAVHIIWLQDRQGCQRQSSPAATGQQQHD